jgi:AcrR family transcriptional regulator
MRAIAEKGLSRVSMADIVTASGLSVGAVYGHFGGKQDLLSVVAHHVLGRRRDEIDALLRDGTPPPGEVLVLVLSGMMRDGATPGALIQIWAEATVDPQIRATVLGAVAILQRAFTRALTAWFDAHPEQAPDGTEDGVRRLLPIMISLAQGFVVQSAILPEFDAGTYLETVRSLLPH